MTKNALEKIKTAGKKRSDQWPKTRKEHILKFPFCAICKDKKSPQVHHIKPFHLHPELELDPENLVTLCEGMERNCHRFFGHLDDFHSINADVLQDIEIWKNKISTRP